MRRDLEFNGPMVGKVADLVAEKNFFNYIWKINIITSVIKKVATRQKREQSSGVK